MKRSFGKLNSTILIQIMPPINTIVYVNIKSRNTLNNKDSSESPLATERLATTFTSTFVIFLVLLPRKRTIYFHEICHG